MILPLVVFLLAGLLILGMMVAERYPVASWRDGLRQLGRIAREKGQPVRLVPQEARIEDLMTAGDGDAYLGTESIAGLVDVVEKAMDSAEARATSWRREVAEHSRERVTDHA